MRGDEQRVVDAFCRWLGSEWETTSTRCTAKSCDECRSAKIRTVGSRSSFRAKVCRRFFASNGGFANCFGLRSIASTNKARLFGSKTEGSVVAVPSSA